MVCVRCTCVGDFIAPNGSGIAEGRDLEAKSFNLAQMPIESTNVQFITKPAFLPNTCYTQAIY